ncbi:hypothetical protein LFM09_04145 [Lentzea alba]|uniref:hypothetical protein n=1 Tax=Lentzea alba TaxID=2714351 RepID=UPI0039BED430
MPFKYRENDVLLIPVTDGSFALARVVLKEPSLLLVLHAVQVRSRDEVDVGSLRTAQPSLLMATIPRSIHKGIWRVAGNCPPATEVPIPPEQAQALPGHVSYSPAAIEEAAKALLGLTPWLPWHDKVRKV